MATSRCSLQLQIDAEAKADALAILDSIAGVDPDNPIIAFMRLQVQTGAIDPVIAEIAARCWPAVRHRCHPAARRVHP